MYYYKVNNDKCNRLVIRDKEILTVNEPDWYITDVSYTMTNEIDQIIVTVQKFKSALRSDSIHAAASRPRADKSHRPRTDKDDRAHSTNKRKRKRRT